MSSSRDDYAKFQEVNAEVVGVSGNLSFSQKAFADFLKLTFPLLSDYPDMKTTDTYGVLNPQTKVPTRSYFVVDKQGIIRYKKIQERGEPLVANERLVEEIRKINREN